MAKKKDMPVFVQFNITDPQDCDKAIDKLSQAINNKKLTIASGLVRMRNVIADELIAEIQNKIYENGSVVTGNMWRSVTKDPPNLNPELEISFFIPVTIGPRVFYAKYVEEKKPFLNPVWEAQKNFLLGRLDDEVREILG